MKPNTTFSNMPKSFWATVRAVSQEIGYTIRGQNRVKAPTVLEINRAFASLNLNTHVVAENGNPTRLTDDLIAYYGYRADVLNNFVESRLMDVDSWSIPTRCARISSVIVKMVWRACGV